MDGTIAIKKHTDTIKEVSIVDENTIIFHYVDDTTDKLILKAYNVISLDSFMSDCVGKRIRQITYVNIPYDEDRHPFEHIVTYCGGVMSWFTYRLYTFHFDDDETVSTLELSNSTPDGQEPDMYFE